MEGGRGRGGGRGGGRGRGGGKGNKGGVGKGDRGGGRGRINVLGKDEEPITNTIVPRSTASPLMPRAATPSQQQACSASQAEPDILSEVDVDEAEAMELWDPMKDMFTSFKNLMQLGEPMRLRSPKTEDFPCPFQKVPGELCFKGTACKYQHGKYTPEMLKGRPKLEAEAIESQEMVEISEALPKKCLPAEGFVTLAWIPTTHDPSEFYVIPWNGWECLCKCSSGKNSGQNITISNEDDEGIEDGKDRRFVSNSSKKVNRGGLEVLNSIINGMKSYYEIPRLQMDGYSAGELVAIKMKTDGDVGFFRAVVMEDTEQIEEAIGVVKVKLLDFGLEVEKSQADVWCLAERFAFVGPLAYKSQLYGVSPVLGKWGKKPSQKFNEFVSGQVCLVEVKKTVYPDLDGLFESPPLLLNVWAKLNGEFVSIKDYLVEEGLGIEWNPFPMRPCASQVLPMKGYEYAVKEIKTDEDVTTLEEIYSAVMEREQSRLDRYVERLKCRHGLDEDLQ